MTETASDAGGAPDQGVATRRARRSLWALMGKVCDAAALVHLVFLALFAYLGLAMLVAANVVSIALFACSRVLLSHRRNSLALALIVCEVTLHAVAASVFLGWDSGFHYYVLTMVGPLVVGMVGTTWSKLARLSAFGLAYVALDKWTHRVAPIYPLDPVLLDAIRHLNFAGMLAIMAFIALTYSRLVYAAENALQALASTDPLTGLHNRRHLVEIVANERRAAPAALGPYVLLCDIDHFKRINDGHGHDMGDLVLQQVAQALVGSVRTTDSVARWGGEEFVVLLPAADFVSAMQTAERMRRAVSALAIGRPEPPKTPAPGAQTHRPVHVTMTVGVARIDPADSIDNAIARADEALYRGKAAGRDRVVPECRAAGHAAA